MNISNENEENKQDYPKYVWYCEFIESDNNRKKIKDKHICRFEANNSHDLKIIEKLEQRYYELYHSNNSSEVDIALIEEKRLYEFKVDNKSYFAKFAKVTFSF